MTAAIPGIMWLSAHKDILFVLSGLLMVLAQAYGGASAMRPVR